jgi:hypothetical protein
MPKQRKSINTVTTFLMMQILMNCKIIVKIFPMK